ncbi:trypco2 family protein [Pseudarthrobacter enclensis]|uniref:trypco2 family protein n=1 Tax=Pseudarthrobacter enclensis TaxID=993070 RepID=UPI003432756D
MSADRIELSSMVTSLRSEITRAWQEGQQEAVGFEAGAIEVELTTEVEIVQVHGKVSAKFWVLSAEAEAGRTKTSTQRITFSFTPKDRRDPSRPLMIAGQAAPGERRPEISSEDRTRG